MLDNIIRAKVQAEDISPFCVHQMINVEGKRFLRCCLMQAIIFRESRHVRNLSHIQSPGSRKNRDLLFASIFLLRPF